MRFPRKFIVADLCVLAVAVATGLATSPTHASATPLGSVASVSARGDHTCTRTTAGGVECWGDNSFGELGNGTDTGPQLCVTGVFRYGRCSTTPVEVTGLSSGVATVSAGDSHTCALTTTGGVKCWGAGVLGNGTTTASSAPVDVTGLTSGVVAVSAGRDHTCALTTSGGIKCWGINGHGQLGNGTTIGPAVCSIPDIKSPLACSTTPGDVIGLTSGVVAVSAGYDHTCALTTSGSIKCWGYNFSGQLGSGTITTTGCLCISTPVDVSSLASSVAAVSAGDGHTCALTTAGGVKCWGDNGVGQLGNGTTTTTGCQCIQTPVDVSGLTSGIAAVSTGFGHACALTTAGGVKCWGGNAAGQLGDGMATASSSTAADVMGLTSGAAAVSAGEAYTCVFTTGGGVKCWGVNFSGELGNGTTTNSFIPADVVTVPPYPVGDVTCQGTISAIDAALILQLTVGLLEGMPCSQNADVNHDGFVNAIDAGLVLQYSAGLLSSL